MKLKSLLRKFYGRHHNLITRYGIICFTNDHGYASFVVISIRTFLHSSLVTWSVIKVIWRVSLLEQELLTIPDHLCFPWDFDFLCVAQSLGFCVVFCRSLYVWPFCFGHCIVCPFSSFCYLFRIFKLCLHLHEVNVFTFVFLLLPLLYPDRSCIIKLRNTAGIISQLLTWGWMRRCQDCCICIAFQKQVFLNDNIEKKKYIIIDLFTIFWPVISITVYM